jgi:hypothetical protein
LDIDTEAFNNIEIHKMDSDEEKGDNNMDIMKVEEQTLDKIS